MSASMRRNEVEVEFHEYQREIELHRVETEFYYCEHVQCISAALPTFLLNKCCHIRVCRRLRLLQLHLLSNYMQL